MGNIDARTLSVDALNEHRRAVKMRLDGAGLKDTTAMCEMSRTTVIAEVKACQTGGWKAIDVELGGRPVGISCTLTAEEEREIRRLIGEGTPGQLKMVYALWTRPASAELIRDPYGFKLAVRTMSLYLGRWGFTRGRSYAQPGQTLVIRVNNKRHCLSAISTVTNTGQMRLKAFGCALNLDILVPFLR